MRARGSWFSFLTFVTLLLIPGCSKTGEPPTGPTPGSDTAFYTAIGASDALGVGGSVVCAFDPDCPGTGYVYLLKRRLQAAGKAVTLVNVGVPAAVMSPTIQALARQIGRSDVPANFIENQVPFVSPTSTHVTVFAGGNDANVLAQAIRAGVVGSDTPNDVRAFVDRQIDQWGNDFSDLIRRIRARAPGARIVAYNLPNLAAFPYVSRNTTLERSVLQRIAVGFAERINASATQNVLVIDLLCEPRLYTAANLAADGFHPNDQGYQLMADLGYPAMANGTAPAPRAACPERTLLPAF